MTADLRSLRLLLAVAEQGSISAAAQALGMRQPSATDRLQRLERQLRLDLLSRSPRGSSLTPQGTAVAGWARDVMTACDRLDAGIEALQRQHDSQLRVSASMTIAEYLLPRWLSQLRSRHPETGVALRVCNSADAARDVLQGNADLGFVEGPRTPNGLEREVVSIDELTLVVPRGHPWARRETVVGAEEVVGAALVARERGSGTRDTLELALKQAGLNSPNPALELGSTAAIKAAVLNGQGVGVLSRLAIDGDSDQRLVSVPVSGLRLRRQLRMVWPVGKRLAGPAAVLAECAGAGRRTRPGLG